ncbi:MAG: hypothetical protein KGI61_01900 [Patescibacteria group bacterium]|nr:hypothetical protein [Patescibacteria group bacterium]
MNRGGLARTVLFVVALLIILGYFGFNLRNIVASPVVHDNLVYAGELVSTGWNNYLKTPVTWTWNNFLRPYVWNPFFDTLKRMQGGGPAITPDQAPKLPPLATSTLAN